MPKTSPLSSLLKWSPVIGAFLIVFADAVWLQFQVMATEDKIKEILLDKKVDVAQWVLLREQTQVLTSHQAQIESMQQHMTPEAIQAWGVIQNTVQEDHLRLNRHLRNHP